jgi:hypothetical protein
MHEDGTVALWVAAESPEGDPGKQLATSRVQDFARDKWHNLKLRFSGTTLAAFVDDAEVLSVKDTTYKRGMAGLVTGGEKDARNTACFDELIVNSVGGAKPAATVPLGGVVPMYKSEK